MKASSVSGSVGSAADAALEIMVLSKVFSDDIVLGIEAEEVLFPGNHGSCQFSLVAWHCSDNTMNSKRRIESNTRVCRSKNEIGGGLTGGWKRK